MSGIYFTLFIALAALFWMFSRWFQDLRRSIIVGQLNRNPHLLIGMTWDELVSVLGPPTSILEGSALLRERGQGAVYASPSAISKVSGMLFCRWERADGVYELTVENGCVSHLQSAPQRRRWHSVQYLLLVLGVISTVSSFAVTKHFGVNIESDWIVSALLAGGLAMVMFSLVPWGGKLDHPTSRENPIRGNESAIVVRFDRHKIESGAYGLACWTHFWAAVNPNELFGVHLFEGDSPGTLNGTENVYCLGCQSSNGPMLDAIQNSVQSNLAIQRVLANPRFVQGGAADALLFSVLPESGVINYGTIEGGTEAHNPRSALASIRQA